VPAPNLLPADQTELAVLTQRLNSAANWFYVLAALSVVNSLIATFGGTIRFIFGLGITSVVDAIIAGTKVGAAGTIISLVFTLAMAGLFVVFGFLSKKGYHWAFIIGMVIYLLDGLLLLFPSDYLGAAFHAYVLFRLYQGLAASRKLSELKQSQSAI
jgi:MFS family permease